MRTWKRQGQAKETAPAAVQLRGGERHPFALLDGYVPLHEPAFGLYRAIREAVPVVDAAVLKLVRLAGGVHVTCADKGLEKRLAEFLRTVPVGWNQVGLQAFLDSYLDCLLTCGKAVGEVVPTRDGRGVAAVLCGNVSDVQMPVGVALHARDGHAAVQLKGFVTVQYSGTSAPALGWTALVADSAGCLRAAGSGESGRMCLVVTRDSEKKTVGLFL